jgi:hypothetical protein
MPKVSAMHVEFLKVTVYMYTFVLTKKCKDKNGRKSGICVLVVLWSCECQLYP